MPSEPSLEGVWCLNYSVSDKFKQFFGWIFVLEKDGASHVDMNGTLATVEWSYSEGKLRAGSLLNLRDVSITNDTIEGDSFGDRTVLTRNQCEARVATFNEHYVELIELSNAVFLDDFDEVKRLVERGVTVDLMPNGISTSPLMIAVKYNKYPMLEYLLGQNPDLSIVNADGETVADVAIRLGDKKTIEMLQNAAE